MNLVIIAAFIIAVCGAAKLDRTYLPPSSAGAAGGSPGSLQAPLTRSSVQGLESPKLPTGSYTNDFGGVVVDAAAPGTRASADADLSGLGAPRPTYGSTDSKVGDAAFRGSVAGFRKTPTFGQSQTDRQFDNPRQGLSNTQIDTHAGQFPSNGQIGSVGNQAHFSSNDQISQNFQGFDEDRSERPQAAKDRNSNILALSNDVNSESYSYGFETDNGIAVGENGVAINGVRAEGGYSYQGDDGQVYKVTYTADEGGYRPQGDHLPTPPPIPEEILKSLEQNAKEEAAGLVDDGSYDAQKYNTDGDYTHDNGGNIQYNGAQLSQIGKRPDSTDSTFINQNGQTFPKPSLGQYGTGSSQNNLGSNGQSSQTNGQFGVTASNSASTFNGQFNQVNRKPTGQFISSGSINGQSGLNNGKPGQIGFSGLESTSSDQLSEVNGQASVQFGSGNQNTHGSFSEQLSQANGNKFGSHFGSAPHSTSQSHSSQSPSGHQENSGIEQTFGNSAGNQFSSSSGQTTFGSQAQFGSQQVSASSQSENQSPDLGSQQNQQSSSSSSQFGSRPTKPGLDQNAGSSSFNSQSAQPQFGSSFKPQGSEVFSGASLNKEQDNQDFGKPSPQIFSGQNFNRPSAGNFNSKKPTTFGASEFGSSTFSQFTQTSGQFGAKNEYLPPGNFNGQKPGNSLGFAQSFNSNSQKAAEKEQTPDIDAFNRPKPGFSSASASTSFRQPPKPLNSFNTLSQSKPNQFTQTNQFSSNNPVEFSSSSQQSGSFSQITPNFDSKPTSIPDAELTTPLEPEEKPAFSQGSHFPSQAKPSFSSFDSKPASNNQEQIKFGFQGNSAFGQQSTSQTMSPSYPTSSPQFSSQFGNSPSLAFQSSVSKTVNPNDKSQFSHNNFGQNQPSFSQGVDNSYFYNQPSKPFHSSEAHTHGSRFPSSSSDQSDGVRSQIQQSSFHSSGKFTESLAPVASTSATQFAQTQGYNGITQAAISPFPSTPAPSQLGTQSQFGSNPTFNQQSTFNTAQPSQPSFNQQSTVNSQFTSSGSLQSKPKFPQSGQTAFPSRPVSQVGQKPLSGSQTLTQFTQSGQLDQSGNTPEPSEGSPQQQTTVTQQYQGPIYEYNKPAEVLPAPTQTDSSSSQTIQAGVTSELKPFGQSQGNQLPTQQHLKPSSQGSSVSSNNQFRPNTQIVNGNPSQDSGIGSQFSSQSVKPFNVSSPINIQFGQNADKPASTFGTSSTSQISQTAQSTPDSSISMLLQQNTQGSKQPFKPFGASQGIQSSFGSKPQLSQNTQFSQNTQSFVNSQASQPNRGSSKTQFGSQTFGNAASSQQNGYFYPGNPKPQFQTPDIAKNQFTQYSQSGRPQAGLNQFNQISQNTQNQFGQNSQTSGLSPFNQHSSQTQFNSGPKPQFGTQSTQFSQNTQAHFGQKTPVTPVQSGQSIASSQAIASGQATASASASSFPQYKPFDSQNKHQFGQPGTPERQDQSGQGTQFGTQSLKPFESNSQEPDADSFKPYGALNSKPLGNAQSVGASKPVFSSACCKPSKDSTPAQSTNNPSQSSFQGTQNFNAQSFAGKGEEFGGTRQPPSFDQTGYHY